MSTTLQDARHAVTKLSEDAFSPRMAHFIAAIADYLDNAVPLSVEVENLKARLAHAEAFIHETYRQVSSLVQAPHMSIDSIQIVQEVQAQGYRVLGNASLNCVYHLTGKCHCPACRVRANA